MTVNEGALAATEPPPTVAPDALCAWDALLLQPLSANAADAATAKAAVVTRLFTMTSRR
jgi:hypothetical protein